MNTPCTAARKRGRTGGYIVAYLLFGIGLLAVVTTGLVAMNNLNSDQIVHGRHRDEIISDALTIRSALVNCGLMFPAGRNGDTNTGSPQFPATGTSGLVRDLTCPGTVTDPSQAPETIWTTLTRSGNAGLSAPPDRMEMTPWRYANERSASGQPDVYFYIEPQSSGETRSANLLRSAVNSQRLNPGGSASAASRLFYTETVTRPSGEQVVRFRSRNLALP